LELRQKNKQLKILMVITKYNVCQVIEDYLNSNKIRYDIHDSCSRGLTYTLHISSRGCYIQVEFNLDDNNDNYVVLQLYDSVDDIGESIYHQTWDNYDEHVDSIDGEIENLIESVKRINKGIVKISAKINQIKDICEEYELTFEEFITLEYDFDE